VATLDDDAELGHFSPEAVRHGIHYRDPARLAQDLSALGLLARLSGLQPR
jgi:hypothetical protein